jgi:Mn-dependent DtxR family transcriptional regulator
MPPSPKRSAVRTQAASTVRPSRPRRQPKAGKKTAQNKRTRGDDTTRRSGQTRSRAGRGLATLFPKVARNPRLFGLAGVCGLVECDGTKPIITVERREELFTKPAKRPRERFLSAASDERIAKLCNAMGNPRRVAMLKAIFIGAGSYAQLAETLGLKAGPLYHHVRELRLAGLLELAQRDTYRLTEYGKYALLLACLSESLLSKLHSTGRE